MSIVAHHNLHIEFRLSIEKILSFEMVAAKGCHARMQTTVLMRDQMRDQITGVFSGDTVAIWVVDDSGYKTHCIFSGQVDGITMEYEGGLEKVTISAVSNTILLDIEKKSRSFQDISCHYIDVINKALGDTNTASAILHVQDALLEKPVIQYKETDWQFIKRMASHLKTSVMPDLYGELPRVHIGLNNGSNVGEIEWVKYKISFDPRYYTDGDILNMPKPSFVFYDIDSYALYGIGDIVSFLGKSLRICGIKYTLTHGFLNCSYRLATPDFFKTRQHNNESLRGISLQGVVLETNREFVRIHLDIDDKQDSGSAYGYTWRPETGNLAYCMPEPGTRVSLYMQSADEFSAVCKNCCRTNGPECSETQMPENRYLTTPYDKRMYWKPDEAGFISLDANSLFKIDDAIGTIFDSSGRLLIQSDEEFTIDGKLVVFDAPKEVTVVRRKLDDPTVINICYNFDIIGNKCGFSTNKAPVEQKKTASPFGEIEEFDISDLSDMIVAAIPAVPASQVPPTGLESGSTYISSVLQGTFVAHLSNKRGGS